MSEQFYEEDRYVTIYHYDKWDKYFTHKEENHFQVSGSGLPAHSTDIEIPNKIPSQGNIYIFSMNKWEEVLDTFEKLNLSEKNYFFDTTLTSINYKRDIIMDTEMPKYREVRHFTNPSLQSVALISKYALIQKDFENLWQYYYDEVFNFQGSILEENPITLYKLRSEGLLLSIKSLIDELVQLTYVFCYQNSFETDKKIKIDCIGDLFNHAKETQFPICKQIILGDNNSYISDNTKFLESINELSNSIKHSFIHYETINHFEDIPNIMSLYKERNDFKNMTALLLNFSLLQVMFGFQANFNRIIHNQKAYLDSAQ